MPRMRTTTNTTATILALFLFLALAACGGDEPAPPAAPPPPADHITVDHILIGVKPGIPTGMAPAEAKKLAYEVMAQLEGGADWMELKKKHTADKDPRRGLGGPYSMANHGVQPTKDEAPRGGMVPAFGDVGFTLQVGEMGMADFDQQSSPFGYHIIKRIK